MPGVRASGSESGIENAAPAAPAPPETAVFKGLIAQRLVALFMGGVLLLNFPLLALWDRDALLFGLPLFPAALFIGWAMLIAVLAWVVEHAEPGEGTPPPGERRD
jgi:hypothetical protein